MRLAEVMPCAWSMLRTRAICSVTSGLDSHAAVPELAASPVALSVGRTAGSVGSAVPGPRAACSGGVIEKGSSRSPTQRVVNVLL